MISRFIYIQMISITKLWLKHTDNINVNFNLENEQQDECCKNKNTKEEKENRVSYWKYQ